MTVKEKIDQLRAELHQHNYNYYVLNAPEISDKEFDDLMRELQDLEKEHPEYQDDNSPTMRVGSDLNKNFTQVAHKYPMLSLGNTYSENEVTDFYERVKKALNEDFEICCELKYDGTSISLTYEDGKLVRAVTRGDGEKGDDVTDNVKTIRTIPLVLHGNYPKSFEIRGEILMPWVVFEELNREKEAREEPLFANPRNAASGTLKLQNSAIVASRKLDAYLYYLLGEELPCDGHYENLQAAASWGFKTSEHTRKAHSLEEVFEYINYWNTERKNLPVATDGIVLKVNSLRQQKKRQKQKIVLWCRNVLQRKRLPKLFLAGLEFRSPNLRKANEKKHCIWRMNCTNVSLDRKRASVWSQKQSYVLRQVSKILRNQLVLSCS